jgi:DNA repair exonuclease SbcCD ATPase subunit
MAIEEKNIQVLLKSFARANNLPLDKDEIWESISAAEEYMQSPIAYAGQTIKVLMDDGKYQLFTLQKDENKNSLAMEEIKASVDESKLKKWVQIVDELPEQGDSQDIIYILTTTGSGHMWTGTEFKVVFTNTQIDTSNFAKLDGATFTGSVILAQDPIEKLEAVTKQYADKIAEKADENKTSITNLLAAVNGINGVVSGHDTDIKTLKQQAEELKTSINTLTGEDVGSSIRQIATEVLSTELLADGNTENFETLKELSAWLADHPEEAADMNLSIQQNTNAIQGHTMVLTNLQSQIDALKNSGGTGTGGDADVSDLISRIAKTEEDISAINNSETGLLAQAQTRLDAFKASLGTAAYKNEEDFDAAGAAQAALANAQAYTDSRLSWTTI